MTIEDAPQDLEDEKLNNMIAAYGARNIAFLARHPDAFTYLSPASQMEDSEDGGFSVPTGWEEVMDDYGDVEGWPYEGGTLGDTDYWEDWEAFDDEWEDWIEDEDLPWWADERHRPW